MLMGDFISLSQMQLPVKIIIHNNGVLGFVAMEMKVAGFLTAGTDLHNPNFAAIANAAGIKGIRVEKSEDLDSALKEAFAHDGPVVVDVLTAKQELSMPPEIAAQEAKGFSLYMLKAIMSGRGDEVVQLVKTNWLR